MADFSAYIRSCRPVRGLDRAPETAPGENRVIYGSHLGYVRFRVMINRLQPIWASFPGSVIRHKVFVPENVDIGDDPGAFIAARTAAEMLYHRGTLGEKRFPVELVLFRDIQDTEPANRVTVDMDIRPVFFVHGSSE